MVLLCGLAFAILVAILEFCWNSKKNAQNDRQSLCAEMAEELRFAVRCHGSRQRPALKRNCVKCSPAGQNTYVPSSFALPHHFGVISHEQTFDFFMTLDTPSFFFTYHHISHIQFFFVHSFIYPFYLHLHHHHHHHQQQQQAITKNF